MSCWRLCFSYWKLFFWGGGGLNLVPRSGVLSAFYCFEGLWCEYDSRVNPRKCRVNVSQPINNAYNLGAMFLGTFSRTCLLQDAISCAVCRVRIGSSPVAPFEAGPNLITDFFTPTYLCSLLDALPLPLTFRGTDWWQVADSSCQGHTSTTSCLVGLFCRRFHSDARYPLFRCSQPQNLMARWPLNKTIGFESGQSVCGLCAALLRLERWLVKELVASKARPRALSWVSV
jgi:hypothetical protein